jgi:hypothetical protein
MFSGVHSLLTKIWSILITAEPPRLQDTAMEMSASVVEMGTEVRMGIQLDPTPSETTSSKVTWPNWVPPNTLVKEQSPGTVFETTK